MDNFARIKLVLGASYPAQIKLLLHTLIAHARPETGVCWPSIETLRKEMGVASKTTARDAIGAAVRRGVISVGDQDGPHRCNLFTILDAKLKLDFETAQASELSPRGVKFCGGTDFAPGTDFGKEGTDSDREGANSDPEPIREPIRKPKHKAPPAKPSAELIDSVWTKCTWKPAGPAAARKAIAKAIGDVASVRSLTVDAAAAFLAERASAYAASPIAQQTEMRFRPKPANWFTDGCYDDDSAAWQLSSAAPPGPSTTAVAVGNLVKRY